MLKKMGEIENGVSALPNSPSSRHFLPSEGKPEEIELTLGLSLNGRFGVDPNSKKLLRSKSSSVSNFQDLETTRLAAPKTRLAAPESPYSPLTRTCSLPVETDEESRKRKEMQMLRLMEAKRKRSEKQRNTRPLRGDVVGNFNFTSGVNGASKSEFSSHGSKSKPDTRNGFMANEALLPPPPLSQGSSGSSSTSEFDSQTPPPGTSKGTEAKSPQSEQSFSEKNDHRPGVGSIGATVRSFMEENGEAKPSTLILGMIEMVKNVLSDMPCVSTKGDGPDGKRIEGFLYRYRKGEEVRIVCVCHGSFLTPAEFVKHAGGGDVEHPLRHIVVNPSPFL